jgi:RNAse (barnase) inhibitor barstar
MPKEIIIDGNNFSTLPEFYEEVENKLTKGLDWKIGRNLDAYDDVLRGGFRVHHYKEPISIKWINGGKSKADLGELFDKIIAITRAHEHIELQIQ